MKGFSQSIANRFQPIWKINNQTGKGKTMPEKQELNLEKPMSDHDYEPAVNIEKYKKTQQLKEESEPILVRAQITTS